MDVLVSHKIKYLIFSNLVASKSCGNEFWGLKAHYVKTSLFKCTSSQCHCLDSGVRERKRCGRQQITAHWPSFSLFILCSDFFFFNALPEVERYYAAHHQISFHLTALCSSSRPSSKALVVSFGGQDSSQWPSEVPERCLFYHPCCNQIQGSLSWWLQPLPLVFAISAFHIYLVNQK